MGERLLLDGYWCLMFYSASTNGFFTPDIHAEMPNDAVEITMDHWRNLLLGQCEGKRIVPDVDGFPVLEDNPAVDPETWRRGMTLPFPNMLVGLVTDGWISEEDGEAWLGGSPPKVILELINDLPPEQRFATKVRAFRPTNFDRLDPLVVGLAKSAGKSDDDLDVLFTTYAQKYTS